MLSIPNTDPAEFSEPSNLLVWSDSFTDELIKQIQETEGTLREDQELSIIYYSGSGEPIELERIGFGDGILMVFEGSDRSANPVRILAAKHAVRLELRVVARSSHQPQARRIEFYKLEKSAGARNTIGFTTSPTR